MATGIPTSKLDAVGCVRSTDFEISYQGKKSIEEIMKPTSKRIVNKMSVEIEGDEKFTNRLYFGDNNIILKKLIEDENVKGRVKLVYIDPPFATNSKFKSRDLEHAYHDNLVGADFIEFMRERLYLIKELLSEDGSIYVHLDEKMAFPIKLIMDEVFGAENYRNWITRVKCSRKNTTKNRYGNITDYIMFYTKSKDYVWNRAYEPWTEEDIKKQYQSIDEEGRRYKKVPVHAPGVRNGETGKEWRGKLPPKGKHWQYTPSRLDEMDRNGEIYWSGNGNPRRKVYFNPEPGIPVQDYWEGMRDIVNQNCKLTGYPTEKNIDLLRRIIKASSNPGDIVLDAFAGSGTTLIAAEESERNWIGIDSGDLAIDTIIKRFAFGTKKIGDYVTVTNTKLHKSDRELRTGFDLYISEDHLCRDDIVKNIEIWKNCF